MERAIRDFPKQFSWKPHIENAAALKKFKKFVVLGMGGSNLTAGLLELVLPGLEVIVHKNYGLPQMSVAELRKRLIIAVSYSGNTEETIDGFKAARKRRLAVVAVATGGRLLELARAYDVPYIELPNTGIQPRLATGFQFMALSKLMGLTIVYRDARTLAKTLNPVRLRAVGMRIARQLRGCVPVIYASARNKIIAYNWKIKFNETGKIPAFYNVVPELNHNEMTGFDVKSSSRKLSSNLYFIFIHDNEDHPRIIKRMKILERLYRERGLRVELVQMRGKGALDKVFSSLILADWIAYYSAQQYRLEPEQVPMVEEFKKLMTR